MPRCIRCQSLAQPSSAEYWHMGETTMRLASSRPASRKGENKALLMGCETRGWERRRGSALLDGLHIGNDGTDLVGVKLEFRHIGWPDMMPSPRASSRDHRVALAEGAERRSILARAGAGAANRMARPAVRASSASPSLRSSAARLAAKPPPNPTPRPGWSGQSSCGRAQTIVARPPAVRPEYGWPAYGRRDRSRPWLPRLPRACAT